MTSWSAKRRFTYGGVVLIVLAIIAGGIFWKIVYVPPSCSDGSKNGDEKGIDCGGSCKNLCSADALNPIVIWSKIFNISGDVYTAVAYVENPNINSKNPNAKYQFNIYDTNNKIITTVTGQTSIPKGKKFAVFETGVILKNAKPKSADFKFINFSPWEKDFNQEPSISLRYSSLIGATTSPRITGKISNESTRSIDQIELVVLVQDANENVVAASRSFVDNLLQRTTQDFVFTWPKPFNLGVEACVNPVFVDLVLDKSGSMRSEGINPPEPFTTVIKTAKDFIKNLTAEDYSAVTSFGTNANQENILSNDKNATLTAIDNISLSSTTEQTNIADGISSAAKELIRYDYRETAKHFIVLLTDGVPTEPTDKNNSNYPIIAAQKAAEDAKSMGISIYTIGLGKNVNEGFLKSISTDDSHYFLAPTKENLSSIYNKISQNLCTKKPNAITVIYRAL